MDSRMANEELYQSNAVELSDEALKKVVGGHGITSVHEYYNDHNWHNEHDENWRRHHRGWHHHHCHHHR